MSNSQLAEGLHYGVKASDYHADPCASPSLSSTLARTLLDKSPAHAALEHPKLGAQKRESTAAMSKGTLVHALLSGSDEIEVGQFENFKTKAAQEWRDGVEASGRVAVLPPAYEEGMRIAGAVRARAAQGIDNTPFDINAVHEVTAIWKEKGCYCRARYDVLNVGDYADIWDYKSCADVSDRGIERSIVKYGYHIQAAFYLRGLETLMPKYRGRTSFVFVFFETTAPYAVRRVTLQPSWLTAASAKVNEAINLWAHCIETNTFPLTPPDTLKLELPAYLDDTDDEITFDQ
jgi:hypothetical protein